LQLITDELRKAQRDHGARTAITAKQLAAFGARVEEHEQIMLQRDRDAETRAVLTLIQGGLQSPANDAAHAQSGNEATVLQPAVAVPPAAKPKLLPRLR
jgi:hypothetical protein